MPLNVDWLHWVHETACCIGAGGSPSAYPVSRSWCRAPVRHGPSHGSHVTQAADREARREPDARYHVRAVGVAVAVLNYLAEHPRKTLSEIAQGLGQNISLVYRMLATLESEGLVLRDRDRRYALGSRTMYLGYQAQRAMPINEVAAPRMQALVEATQETVHLAVRNRFERVIVAMVESPQPVRVSTPVGTKFPLHYGGTGLAILAFLSKAEQEEILSGPLSKKTPTTVADPVKIRELLTVIARQGYHVAVGDFAHAAFSIAAPIFGPDSAAVGAICAVGPEVRLEEAIDRDVPDMVVRVATDISRGLGWQS